MSNLVDFLTPFTTGTKQTATGSSVDFTGIPPGVKFVAIKFDAVSKSGANQIIVQLGDAGGFETTGYQSGTTFASSATLLSTTGFIIYVNSSSRSANGSLILLNGGNNEWSASGVFLMGGLTNMILSGGLKTISEELTQIRITSSGADTLDAGDINIMYM